MAFLNNLEDFSSYHLVVGHFSLYDREVILGSNWIEACAAKLRWPIYWPLLFTRVVWSFIVFLRSYTLARGQILRWKYVYLLNTNNLLKKKFLLSVIN